MTGCAFFKRNVLSIRVAQATNIDRATCFKRFKVGESFYPYRSLIGERSYPPSRLWNMDETGISNIQKPGCVVATKGVCKVEKMTSGECGATVTAICGMNPAGNYTPPMFIFPRKRMQPGLMNQILEEQLQRGLRQLDGLYFLVRESHSMTWRKSLGRLLRD